MVSWVPYAPASCSTRGKPFPAGAWRAGAGQWVGAVRCGARYWAGPVSQAGPALVCRPGLRCPVGADRRRRRGVEGHLGGAHTLFLA